jgi:hypothetical protein
MYDSLGLSYACLKAFGFARRRYYMVRNQRFVTTRLSNLQGLKVIQEMSSASKHGLI